MTIACCKCNSIAQFSIHGNCLVCGNKQFKSKATIVSETNAVVQIMVESAVDRLIMAMVKVNDI